MSCVDTHDAHSKFAFVPAGGLHDGSRNLLHIQLRISFSMIGHDLSLVCVTWLKRVNMETRIAENSRA